MIDADQSLQPADLLDALTRHWEASATAIRKIDDSCPPGSASPVFTVGGAYRAQGWTEWTQGFQHGAAFLQFDATGEASFLELGRKRTLEVMAPHLTHTGVHDHGFNNVSTYGNLWRLGNEGKIDLPEHERNYAELALKVTGAVQASRWKQTADGTGYVYSFNGPQSLFIDTIRTMRALSLAHLLGHRLSHEGDAVANLLDRSIEHAINTARHVIWYGGDDDGELRDAYDVRGRTAHEALFNTNNGAFRAPSTQQGYSPFSTWTRGQAWAMVGFPEQLEFLDACVTDEELEVHGGRHEVERIYAEAAEAVCDHYLENTPTDGIPYWDTGAPGLAKMGDWGSRPADPFNDHEPVDSSAAAIGAQGLLRMADWLDAEDAVRDENGNAERYRAAGLTITRTLLGDAYLSTDPDHEGLLLHSVYHRPNGWDHVPAGRKVPCGEACMWGDYHLRELAVVVGRMAEADSVPHRFFGPV
ncbi:glycoside hydrolase family 88 protein [Phycisphaera mikurensis]|uniref:Putative glycoside hydrolase n=1 Tax=Phycisphaera mikurensis (strain NBRC 102666 / KCTC 22515 / FYK2301M01) TaxID=1142394 RepID=I0ICM9_PHYMF|nr:glycoside hydrolase family 88 protein [Phycisphaera mikurensis]MBB6442108.1 hypothetical protein [Phycisphaera mikurensis]BAM03017.1 putative glycoside hydrolase [Phycisphaera mikurensis NBRC 102666]